MKGIRSASEPYAKLLASQVRKRFATDWGLSETGATGPTGNRYGDAAGHSCTGVAGVNATAMTLDRPDLKVLLMSGFKDGMLILNEGWHFLNKPFVASQLKALVVGLVDPDKKSKFAS